MKILALEQEIAGTTAADFQPHLRTEAARVWELQQTGIIREIYFRQDEPSAVLILECSNADEARDILNSMPLVKENLITFDIIPLAPYPGFSRLFL